MKTRVAIIDGVDIADGCVNWRSTNLVLCLSENQIENYKKYLNCRYAYSSMYTKNGDKVFQKIYDVNWVLPVWKIGYLYKKTSGRQVEVKVFVCKNNNFLDLVMVAECNKVVNKEFERFYISEIKVIDYYCKVDSISEVHDLIGNSKFLAPIKDMARKFLEENWRKL